MNNPICKGNSIHECEICGEPYFCYNCPDVLNPSYSENTCETCLSNLLGIKHPKTVIIGHTAIVMRGIR